MELLVSIQRWIQASLSAELSAFAATGDWMALARVLPFGIVFGAVHALTPGHSKTVLASYLLGSRMAALRAMAVAMILSLTHVGSAVLIALTAAPLVTRTIGGAGQAPILEIVSRGLLVAFGLWLILRALRRRPHAHGEGLAVGFVAGLVPCPLTLFAMFLALARGVPEAGLIFAASMMLGVTMTLAAVALSTVLARDRIVLFTARHEAPIDGIVRLLDCLAGTLLILIGLRALLL